MTVDALLTDGVLWYNLVVDIYNLSQSANSPSWQFRSVADDAKKSSFRLSNHTLDICPNHCFGLVPRDPKFIGLTFDRYKNLRESLQKNVKAEGDQADIMLAMTFNGDADLDLDNNINMEASLPPPSPGLGRSSKRKYEQVLDVAIVNNNPRKLLCIESTGCSETISEDNFLNYSKVSSVTLCFISLTFEDANGRYANGSRNR
ncbi:hypothetical protein K439DRAFT_1612951 [Ramaria rubella]|nr:hypothetical protein K439DRAFT_1612951 [Ramaria rubella]